MKQGAVINRIVMLLLLAAILLYLGGAAWQVFRDPYPTTQAYAYQVDDTVEATGYLCRSEQLLTGGTGVVRLLPGEGEKVAAGSTVALLYADTLSVERSERLETLRAELKQAEQVQTEASKQLQSNDPGAEAANALVNLRASVEAGDFTHLEAQTSEFKSAVYRQALRYGNVSDLSSLIANTKSEIAALEAQGSQGTGVVRVSDSGVFSGHADGYENVLLPDQINDLTPTALDALPTQVQAVPSDVVGKLITDSKWYFVCTLAVEQANRLVEDGVITARFSRDWSGEVNMTVERIGAPQNGRVAVVLSSTQFLSQTTLLRKQTVELVFSTWSGIRVPAKAVRVEEDRKINEETGQEETVPVTCVYVQTGKKADRKPVEILVQGEDYYLVKPFISDKATKEEEKKSLRAGDAVVIASQPIWDGKVLQ